MKKWLLETVSIDTITGLEVPRILHYVFVGICVAMALAVTGVIISILRGY